MAALRYWLCATATLSAILCTAQATPLEPSSPELRDAGTDFVNMVIQKYTAVKTDSVKLQRDLDAAVKAGRLTEDQIYDAKHNLEQDVLTADQIDNTLLEAMNNCWAYIGSPWALQACQVRAAGSVLHSVTQLIEAHGFHKAQAEKLLSSSF